MNTKYLSDEDEILADEVVRLAKELNGAIAAACIGGLRVEVEIDTPDGCGWGESPKVSVDVTRVVGIRSTDEAEAEE